MRIALGADHAGRVLKDSVARHLQTLGHQVTDLGTYSANSVDYPDYARGVAEAVTRGDAERGILVCSTGIGMCIAANKFHGIRAALGVNADAVQLTRAHNDANILALGARYTTAAEAGSYVDIFLTTPFDGGRHARRIEKIAEIETKESNGEACRSGS